jgi:hypothetical protein
MTYTFITLLPQQGFIIIYKRRSGLASGKEARPLSWSFSPQAVTGTTTGEGVNAAEPLLAGRRILATGRSPHVKSGSAVSKVGGDLLSRR